MRLSWVPTALLLILGASACTGGGPLPPVGQYSRPESVCDVATADLVTKLLEVPSSELGDGGCFSDDGTGVVEGKRWTMRTGKAQELTLSTYVLRDSLRPLYDGLPEGLRCEVEIAGGRRPCLTTLDSFAVLLDDGAIVGNIGDGALALPAVPVDVDREPSGQALGGYVTAVAAQLAQKRQVHGVPPARTTPTAIKPSSPARVTSQPVPNPDQFNRGRCVLHLNGGTRCASLDPTVEVMFDSRSVDTSGCTFTGVLDFGDGSARSWVISGGRGLLPMATHRYAEAGRYSLTTTAEGSGEGGCLAHGGNYSFTLDPPPTPSTCQNKFDDDIGRAYLYSMVPAGSLRNAKGEIVTSFDWSPWNSNVYTDEAGVEWTLQSSITSGYHQPVGWSWTDLEWPFLKFVSAEDSSGGAFEAVLMPDGVRIGTPFTKLRGMKFTYEQANWLMHGPGMPTYNLAHPDHWWQHLTQDMRPHNEKTPTQMVEQGRKDDRYVIPAHILDPRTGDWRTYRERLAKLRARILDNGARFDPATGTLTGDTTKVDADLRWVAEELTACTTE